MHTFTHKPQFNPSAFSDFPSYSADTTDVSQTTANSFETHTHTLTGTEVHTHAVVVDLHYLILKV